MNCHIADDPRAVASGHCGRSIGTIPEYCRCSVCRCPIIGDEEDWDFDYEFIIPKPIHASFTSYCSWECDKGYHLVENGCFKSKNHLFIFLSFAKGKLPCGCKLLSFHPPYFHQ